MNPYFTQISHFLSRTARVFAFPHVFVRLFTFAFLLEFFLISGLLHAEEDSSSVRWEPVCEPGCGGWMTSVEVSPFDGKRLLVGGDLLSIGLSTNRGETWESVFGFLSTEIGDTTFHPSDPKIVWAGTMSGPYKSEDGGKTWVEKRGGEFPEIAKYSYSAPIEKILFDPNDAQHLYAFGGSSRNWGSPGEKTLWGAVWESSDGGETWKKTASLEKNIVSACFAAKSSQILMAAVSQKGIFRSEDGGKTWSDVSEGLPHRNVERIAAHPENPDVFWVSLNACEQKNEDGTPAVCLPGGIFRTEDGAKTWIPCNEGLKLHASNNPNLTARFKAFCVAPSNPDVLYTSDSAWDGAKFYRSDDGGKSWRIILQHTMNGVDRPVKTAYPSGYGVTVLSVNPKNENEVYGAGAEFILASFDGGGAWVDLTSVPVNDGTPWTWKGRGYSGLCCTNFRYDPYREGRSVLLAMDAGKCWESDDFMKTWKYHGQKPSPWGGGADASYAKDGTVYVTTGQGNSSGNVLKGALNTSGPWTPLATKESGLPDGNTCVARGVFTSPDDSQCVWVVFGGKIYRTKNGGVSWDLLCGSDSFGWIAPVPKKNRTFFISGKTGLWKTTNGKTFTFVGGPKNAGRITVDARGRVLLAAFHGPAEEGGLWRYDEKQPETSRWTHLHRDPESCVASAEADPTNAARILMISDDHPYHDHIRCRAVYLSNDDGKTWNDISDGLPTQRASCAAFNPFHPNEIVLGTGGCGFFRAALGTNTEGGTNTEKAAP